MIRFHRPFEGYYEGQVVKLHEAEEYALVAQNYADFVDEPAEEPKPEAKPKKKVSKE